MLWLIYHKQRIREVWSHDIVLIAWSNVWKERFIKSLSKHHLSLYFFSQKHQAKHASMYITIDLKANKRYYRWFKNTLKSFNKIFLYGYYKYIHTHMHVKRQQKLGTML